MQTWTVSGLGADMFQQLLVVHLPADVRWVAMPGSATVYGPEGEQAARISARAAVRPLERSAWGGSSVWGPGGGLLGLVSGA